MLPVPISSMALVFLGGGTGAMLRFLTGHFVTKGIADNTLPWGTYTANVIGSFLIGAVIMLTMEHHAHSGARLLLVTGLLGGYTTFSAFSFEVSEMLSDKRYAAAATYSIGSVVLCVAATLLGALLARSLRA